MRLSRSSYSACGFIWSGKYFQIGAEAVVPINSRTGNDVGFIAQLHFYLDDLFPPHNWAAFIWKEMSL